MNTLDRYIARQYLFNVIALLVLLFSFVVTVDVALNLDRFFGRVDELTNNEAAGVRRLTLTALLVFDIWWPRLLQLFTYMVGLALVGAMGFTFTQLVRHREMVAMLAGGVSLRRVMRPVLLVAALMMALKVANQEFVLSNPRVAPLLARDHGDALNRRYADFKVSLTADGQGRLFYAGRFDPQEGALTSLSVWERNEKKIATAMITAERAVWRDGGWDLEGARYQPLELGPGGSPLPARAGAAAPARIETDLAPSALMFNRNFAFSQSLSWAEIGRMLSSPQLKPDMREKLERVRWGRVANTLSGLLALVVTVPFFALREPRNMLVQSLKCAPVGIVSLIGAALGSVVEWPGLPASFAVFVPVLVLLPIAVERVWSMRT